MANAFREPLEQNHDLKPTPRTRNRSGTRKNEQSAEENILAVAMFENKKKLGVSFKTRFS